MSFLNNVLRSFVDLLLMPFQALPAWVSLVPISFAFGIVALLVWKHCSNQAALQATKDKIAACFYEIRLFNDDLRAILRAQGQLLLQNGKYLALNLVPFFVIFIPTLPFIAQLQFHYGYEGLEPGQQVVLTADFTRAPETPGTAQTADASSAPPRPEVELRVPAGVEVQTPPVWVAAKSQMAWRIAGLEPGHYDLELTTPGAAGDAEPVVTKSLVVSDELVRRSPVRQKPSFLGQLLYPAEPPIDRSSPIERIEIDYPMAEVNLFGLELQWMIWFVILSILFALLLRKRFDVTF